SRPVPFTRGSHAAAPWLPVVGLPGCCGGPSLGISVGAIGWPIPCAVRRCGRTVGRFGAPSCVLSSGSSSLARGFVPRRVARRAPRGIRVGTWLILPVVICLSQRLSHACLSISNLYCETANGSLNQLSFI